MLSEDRQQRLDAAQDLVRSIHQVVTDSGTIDNEVRVAIEQLGLITLGAISLAMHADQRVDDLSAALDGKEPILSDVGKRRLKV